MAIQCSCPACQENYRLPDAQLGKRVRCRGCGDTFIVKAEDDVPVLEEATAADLRRPARKPPAKEIEELPVLELDESEEDVRRAPVRRSRSTPPPPSRRCDEEEDEEEEEEAATKGSGGTIMMVLGIVGVLLFIIVGGGALAAYMVTRSAANRIQAEMDKFPDLDKGKFNPPGDDKDKLPPFDRDKDKDKDKDKLPPIVIPREPEQVASVDGAIEALRSSDAEKQKQGLNYLKSAPVDPPRRDEVARLLNPIMAKMDGNNGHLAVEVAKTWATKDNVDDLAAVLENTDATRHFTALTAMDALVTVGDEPSIELLVKQFFVAQRLSHAGKCLARVGSKAEKAVVKHVHYPSTQVRGEVARLLKAYRTNDETILQQAIPDLESKNAETRNCALDSVLAIKPPNLETQESVAKLLENLLTDNDFSAPGKALTAMQTWATKDNIPALILLCKDARKIDGVLKVLRRFPDDERLIPFMAELFVRVPAHRATATQSLKSFGSKAENALLEMLVELAKRDVQTRRAAYELLSEIGTRESIKALKAFAVAEGKKGGNKENAKVASAAAIAIQDREKAKAAKDKDK